MKVSVALFGVVLSTAPPLPCFAGPCSGEIDAIMSRIDAGLEAVAAAGRGGAETAAATTHHQPTPKSIAELEAKLGDVSTKLVDEEEMRWRERAAPTSRATAPPARMRWPSFERGSSANQRPPARPAQHFSNPRISSARTSQPHDFPWMRALEPPPEPAAVDHPGSSPSTKTKRPPSRPGLTAPNLFRR